MNESTQPQTTAATHNPDGLPADKLPAGYRFLNTSEIMMPAGPDIPEILLWDSLTSPAAWDDREGQGWTANCTNFTYCTTLTPEELKARRAQK